MNLRRDPMTYVAAALIAAAFMIAVWVVFVASSRQLTPLESALFQILALAAGISGSFIFGRIAAMKASRDIIRPHARAAFRRVLFLRRSLIRLSVRIETMQDERYDHRLDLIHAVVNEQADVSQDALDDWRDVIPHGIADMGNMDAAPGAEDNADQEEDDAPDWET